MMAEDLFGMMGSASMENWNSLATNFAAAYAIFYWPAAKNGR
jgi:hypothetical protein